MPLLTLESDQSSWHWPAIEQKLANLLANLEIVSQAENKRTYQFTLADHEQPIPLFKELQTLLMDENVHFFICIT